jgi:hypothetical protein
MTVNVEVTVGEPRPAVEKRLVLTAAPLERELERETAVLTAPADAPVAVEREKAQPPAAARDPELEREERSFDGLDLTTP